MKPIYYRFILVVLGMILGSMVLYTPHIVPSSEQSKFSAQRVADDIFEIAKVPHTIEDKEALEDVRDYMIGRLTELNSNPIVTTYPQTDPNYDITEVNNILAQIDGTSNSYILLMAHYDSSPAKRVGEESGSKGAADDGYGLGTILEILNVIQQMDEPMVNGIKVLITDAEEIGLYGAKQEVENNQSFFSDVAFVINIEARGIKGPAIMFETSLNNKSVIQLYKEARLPVSFSFAGDVYSKMPNGTDFTPVIDYGVQGINIAVLDNLDYYHTPKDNYNNINLRSIQHYGAQLYPIVKEFVTNEAYSDIDSTKDIQNSIYFTFLPGVFVHYSVTMQWALSAIAIIGFAGLLFRQAKNKQISIKRVFAYGAMYLAGAILFAIIGILISMLLGFIFNIPFSITYMPNIPVPLMFFFLFVLLETLAVIWFNHKFKHQAKNLLYGGMVFHTFLLIVFLKVLMGGSYLFLFPLMFFIIFEETVLYLNKVQHKHTKMITKIVRSQTIVWPVVLFTPIVYLLYLALTLGALGVAMLFLLIPLSIVIPSIYVVDQQ